MSESFREKLRTEKEMERRSFLETNQDQSFSPKQAFG
jgi:hypothetical protein